MVDDDALARLLVSEIPGLVAAYRFGSTATGETHRESDVDVAVLSGPPLDSHDRLHIASRIAQAIGRDADVVDLRRASTVLRMQVISKGTALRVGDEAARGHFEDFVYSDYARLNEERREILRQVRRDGTIHGR